MRGHARRQRAVRGGGRGFLSQVRRNGRCPPEGRLGDAAWREWLRAASTMDGRCASCLKRCLAGIASWLGAAGEMVLVTNDVFADDGAYDKETLAYRAVLGAANRVLARRCARVVEVVCGIPVAVKGGLG